MRAYRPYAALVDPARPNSALIQTVVGFIAIEFLYQLGVDLLDYLLVNLVPDVASIVFDGVAPIAVLYDLLSFAVLALLVVWVCWRSHDRGLRSLIGAMPLFRDDFRRALIGAGAIHLAVLFIIPWGREVAGMIPLANWLVLLPVSMVALFVQTGAEELFYRGYLQQQLAARFRQTWVWMVVPNIAFAAVHWYNGEDTTAAIHYVVWAFVFGLAASDLTARSGTLGAAIGFHLANNAFAFLIVDTAGRPGSGLALFLYPVEVSLAPDFAPDATMLPLFLLIDLMVIAVCWLAVRVAIRR